MADILENIFIMILAVVALLMGGYLILVILGWGMKIKSGHREQEGLTDLLSTLNRQKNARNASTDQKSDNND
jgi:hypothetical protein